MEQRKKKYLFLFIGFSLLTLIGYKYLYWLLYNLTSFVPYLQKVAFFSRYASPVPQIPPLGISFFTFHSISYLIDIYRKKITEKPRLSDFLCYFFMFPHLVAGPIVRYVHIQNDLGSRQFSKQLFEYGIARFLIGLNKKILIANSVAPLADVAFFHNSSLGLFDAWLGIIAYAVQIYFDFSGYSDMAIGLAAMMGFHFHENFNSPYRSKSIREFWQRWHISLSTWLRDYLYIPLGGSHGSSIRTYINLFIVFVLCGLWHGAQYTFLLWGIFHGFLLFVERLGIGSWLERQTAFVSRTYCLLMVTMSWVFFRAWFTRSGQSLFRVTVFRKYRSRHDGHPAGTTESCGFRDWHLDSVVPIETLLCGIGSNACLCLVSLYRQRFAGIPFSDSFIHGGEKSIHLF